MKLRQYQIDIIEQARALMREKCKSILIQAPTGSGKTILVAFMLKTARERGMASWFIVHRRELIKQSILAFSEVGVPHGIIANNFMEDKNQLVQIASIQTLARRFDRFKKPTLVIWDETQHLAAGSWSKIFSQFQNAYHIGLTATPERLDGKGLDKYYQSMILGPTVKTLIDEGWLAKYKIFSPPGIKTDGIKTVMGDFAKPALSIASDKPSITGCAIQHYLKLAKGKRAVVFCVSIEHSKHVVDEFKKHGIPSEHVDGETETEVRDAAIKRFQEGVTKVLSNVELFGEGFDLPALDCAILLRPTQSLALYLQQVGRSLRPFEGKPHAIILDHAGNTERHGLPCEDRHWSLQGHAGQWREKKNGQAVRICPKCYGAQSAGGRTCIFCGAEFKVKPREVEHKEGELVEIDQEKFRRIKRQEQGRCETYQDLVALGKARGYKRPQFWAGFVLRARQARKLVEK